MLLADSQMLWSDCYATLLISYRTNSISLGTGVTITGTRPAPVRQHCFNQRPCARPNFFGVGSGTARRVMGLPPQKIKSSKFTSKPLSRF